MIQLNAITIQGKKATSVPVEFIGGHLCKPVDEVSELRLQNAVQIIAVTLERPNKQKLIELWDSWNKNSVDSWLLSRNLSLTVRF